MFHFPDSFVSCRYFVFYFLVARMCLCEWLTSWTGLVTSNRAYIASETCKASVNLFCECALFIIFSSRAFICTPLFSHFIISILTIHKGYISFEKLVFKWWIYYTICYLYTSILCIYTYILLFGYWLVWFIMKKFDIKIIILDQIKNIKNYAILMTVQRDKELSFQNF